MKWRSLFVNHLISPQLKWFVCLLSAKQNPLSTWTCNFIIRCIQAIPFVVLLSSRMAVNKWEWYEWHSNHLSIFGIADWRRQLARIQLIFQVSVQIRIRIVFCELLRLASLLPIVRDCFGSTSDFEGIMVKIITNGQTSSVGFQYNSFNYQLKGWQHKKVFYWLGYTCFAVSELQNIIM